MTTDFEPEAQSAPAMSINLSPALPLTASPSSAPKLSPELLADATNPNHEIRVVARFKITKSGKPDRYFIWTALSNSVSVAKKHFQQIGNARIGKIPDEKVELVELYQVDPAKLQNAIELAKQANQKLNPTDHETADQIFDTPARLWSEPLWEDSSGGDSELLNSQE